MSAGNELDTSDTGMAPVVLATGARPRRFMGEGFEGDFNLAGADESSDVIRDLKVRSQAREAHIRSETAQRIERAMKNRSHAMQSWEPNTLVKFWREGRDTRVGYSRSGHWRGPAIITVAHSHHGGRGPSSVTVLYNSRQYLCHPNGVREIVVDAARARELLRESRERRDVDQPDIDLRDEQAATAPPPDEPEDSGDSDYEDPVDRATPDEPESPPRQRKTPKRPRATAAVAYSECEVKAQKELKAIVEHPLIHAPKEKSYHLAAAFFETPDHDYGRQCIELAFNVEADEIDETSDGDMRGIIESCFNATIARKRALEIKWRDLNDREKVAFRGAKKKEFGQ